MMVVGLVMVPDLKGQDIEAIGSAPPFTLGGAFSAGTSAYGVSGIERRQTPFTWTVSGSATADLYGVQMPFSFVLSERERDFRQPFNQFGISPRYKWATAHLGYRSMNLSRYTLAGRTFLGAGIELNPGVFRLAAMYGRLERAVEEDTTRQYILPSYERKGYAIKVGFGSDANFIDFSYLRAKDDTNSLRQAPVVAAVTPAENAVLATSVKFTFIPELSFDAEGAASIFTRDLRSPSLGIENQIPGFLLDFYTPNISTTLALAVRGGLNVSLGNYGVRLGYERIEPGFNSLGADYFNTDIENWTIAPRLSLLDRKLRLSGSIGIQHDNLLNQKLARTNRLIGSGSIVWSPDRDFSMDAAYTNYSTGQVAGRQRINDTVAVRNVTQSATLSPRLLIEDGDMNHSFALVAGYQDFTDQNGFTGDLTDNHSTNGSLLYSLTLLKSAITGGASLLYARTSYAGGTSTVTGLNVNGTVGLLEDNALTLGASLGISRTSLSGLTTGASTVLNESLTTGYRFTTYDQLNLTIYSTQSSGFTEFSEINAQLSYSRSFSWTP
jgi:hypothetical protein